MCPGTDSSSLGEHSPLPDEVFTPSRPASDLSYVSRESESTITDLLHEPGAQLFVYGRTGVGKTSVINYCRAQSRSELVQCESTSTLLSVLQQFTTKLIARKPEYQKQYGLKVRIPGVEFHTATTEMTSRESDQTLRAYEIIDLIGPECWKLVIDDFEKIVDIKERVLIAQFAKSVSDLAPTIAAGPRSDSAKVILIGIGESFESLVSADESLKGRFACIKVTAMSDMQIRQVLVRGFNSLGLRYSASVIDGFVELSEGYPRLAHRLGLEAAKCAIGKKASYIDREIQAIAVQATIRLSASEYQEKYRTAIRTKEGAADTPLVVLSKAASIREHEFTIAQVAKLCPEERYDRVGRAMAHLITDSRGNVLQRVKGKRGLYRFKSTLFKTYVRMKNWSDAPPGGEDDDE